MEKLSGYVVMRKITACDGRLAWFALWRGTRNRVKRSNGELVQAYTKQADLRFDLLNNPMESGVLSYVVTA